MAAASGPGQLQPSSARCRGWQWQQQAAHGSVWVGAEGCLTLLQLCVNCLEGQGAKTNLCLPVSAIPHEEHGENFWLNDPLLRLCLLAGVGVVSESSSVLALCQPLRRDDQYETHVLVRTERSRLKQRKELCEFVDFPQLSPDMGSRLVPMQRCAPLSHRQPGQSLPAAV